MAQLGLVQTVDGLGQHVVITVALAAQRGRDADLKQPLGVADGQVLRTPVAGVDQGVGIGPALVECLLAH